MRRQLIILLTFNLSAASFADQTPTAAISLSDAEQARFFLTPHFDSLDCTQSGYIEEGEVDEHMAMLFRPLDLDGSRTITENEFVTGDELEKRGAQRAIFLAMDSDGDKNLTVTEYRNHISRLLRSTDDDQDGEVTREELESVD